MFIVCLFVCLFVSFLDSVEHYLWKDKQEAFYDLLGFGTSSKMYYDRTLHEAFSRGLKTHLNDLPITIEKNILLGRFLLTEYNGTFYSKSQNLGRELCRAYDKVLEDYDVLLMPTIPKKAQSFPPVKLSIAGMEVNECKNEQMENKLMHKNLNKEKTHHTLLLLQPNASIHLLIFLYFTFT